MGSLRSPQERFYVGIYLQNPCLDSKRTTFGGFFYFSITYYVEVFLNEKHKKCQVCYQRTTRTLGEEFLQSQTKRFFENKPQKNLPFLA